MLDLNKPVTTRAGHRARIICTDRKYHDRLMVVALITRSDTLEVCFTYDAEGHIFGYTGLPHSNDDLINPVKKEIRWAYIFPSAFGCFVHGSKEDLIKAYGAGPTIGCVGYLKGYFEDDVLVNVEFEKK